MSRKAVTIPEGLPDHLPEGERLLWQGNPDWKRLAINAFHVRKVMIYFVLVTAAQVAARLISGSSLSESFQPAPYVLASGAIACGLLLVLAYASARTTLYSLTNKRLFLKLGIALPAYINLPLQQIDSAIFADTGKSCGTICFRTAGDTRLAYLLLWPHARPWHINRPQPALRDIPNAEMVAGLLAQVLSGFETTHKVAAPSLDMVPAE